MKCPKESNNNLQAPTLQIKPILKMFHIHLSKITGHLYAHRCDWVHVHTQDTEQPSGKPPHISLRTKVTRQDKKENPHKENLPQKTFIAQIPDLQLPWNMQWDELLEKQIV